MSPVAELRKDVSGAARWDIVKRVAQAASLRVPFPCRVRRARCTTRRASGVPLSVTVVREQTVASQTVNPRTRLRRARVRWAECVSGALPLDSV